MSEVLVVTVVVSIASLKVTAMVELTETEVAESAGEVEETVGAVVSIPVFSPATVYSLNVSSFLAQDNPMRRINIDSIRVNLFIPLI